MIERKCRPDDPKKVWKQYEDGVSYKNAIDLFETVSKNERMYIGDQWHGVNAPDLDKPVINIIKRIENYKTSIIVSDDIGYDIECEEDQKQLRDALMQAIDGVLEDNDITTMNRKLLTDAAINGDCCIAGFFDPNEETGQDSKGKIKLEVIQNINTYFANPYDQDVQSQEWIMIARRCFVESIRGEAEMNGMDPDSIRPDDDSNQGEESNSNKLVTVLTKFWKVGDRVHFCKTTRTACIKEDTETEMCRYPVAWMNWSERRSSMHGMSDVKEAIPNQLVINKLMALYVRSVQMTAFPKVVYDSTRIREWTNKVGAAIRSYGAVGNDIANVIRGADTSYQVADVIQRMIDMTKDAMGASDAALGNIRAENTSAIVAVQQATAYPLQLVKNNFKSFVEQYVRFIADMIAAYYGIRECKVDGEQDPTTGEVEKQKKRFDFGTIRSILYSMKVNVGDSSYWSVISQCQTLDNLMANGILTDTKLYLESIPSNLIPNKAAIIRSVERMQKQQQHDAPEKQMNEEEQIVQQNLPFQNTGNEQLDMAQKKYDAPKLS